MNPGLVVEGRAKRCRGERRTCTHVAGLLGMKMVVPRAIAYVAVQVSRVKVIRRQPDMLTCSYDLPSRAVARGGSAMDCLIIPYSIGTL